MRPGTNTSRAGRRPSTWVRGALVLTSAATIGAALTHAPAQAADSQKVTASKSVDRSCHATYVGGADGTQTVTSTAPVTGLIRARLSGSGDWDLGVFDASSGRSVAGSAGFASNELAEGFVKKGQKLRVQACRFRGSASSANLSISYDAIAERSIGKMKIVDVNTPTRKQKQRLQSLGHDLTESAAYSCFPPNDMDPPPFYAFLASAEDAGWTPESVSYALKNANTGEFSAPLVSIHGDADGLLGHVRRAPPGVPPP